MPADLAATDPVVIELPEQVRPGGPGGGGPRDFEPGGDGWDGGGDGWNGGPDGIPGARMLAMQLLIVSISIVFITIGLVYFLRSRTHKDWQPVALPSFLWLSTSIIVASSGTLEAARRAFKKLRVETYGRWIVTTALLGLLFLVSQLLALRQLLARGIYLPGNPHSSLFYVVTGVHGLHLLGGMLALFYLVLRAAFNARRTQAELRNETALIAAVSLYWHFLDGLWVCVFAGLLLFR